MYRCEVHRGVGSTSEMCMSDAHGAIVHSWHTRLSTPVAFPRDAGVVSPTRSRLAPSRAARWAFRSQGGIAALFDTSPGGRAPYLSGRTICLATRAPLSRTRVRQPYIVHIASQKNPPTNNIDQAMAVALGLHPLSSVSEFRQKTSKGAAAGGGGGFTARSPGGARHFRRSLWRFAASRHKTRAVCTAPLNWQLRPSEYAGFQFP